MTVKRLRLKLFAGWSSVKLTELSIAEGGAVTDLTGRIGTIMRGSASGLIPMAIFTPIYAFWPVVANPLIGSILFALALGWSAYLAVRAVAILRDTRTLPRETNAYDARIAKGMTIISSIQGALILTSIVVLIVFDRWEWILPVVVLIVAVHFFPMPSLFERTIDYYLGSVMLLIAGTGIILTSQSSISWTTTWAVTGFGAALVTSAYGLYIDHAARTVFARYQSALGTTS